MEGQALGVHRSSTAHTRRSVSKARRAAHSRLKCSIEQHLYQYCATSPAPAAAMDRVRHVCASVSCATAEKYDADRVCSGCRSVFYCSPERQRADWKGHKPACKVATAEREASQIVRVGRGGGSAPPAAAPERVGHPASQWVADAARGEAEALCRLAACYYDGNGPVLQGPGRAQRCRAGGRTVEAGRGGGEKGCGRLPADAGRGRAAGGACLMRQGRPRGLRPRWRPEPRTPTTVGRPTNPRTVQGKSSRVTTCDATSSTPRPASRGIRTCHSR